MIIIRNFILVLALIFLPACQDPRKENPQPKDLYGQWESASIEGAIPYAMLDFDYSGFGRILSIGNYGDIVVVGEVYDFKSKERMFEAKVDLIIDDSLKNRSAYGGIIDQQLCIELLFKESKDKSFSKQVCFTKLDTLSEYRKLAFEFLEPEKNQDKQ